MSIKDGFSGSRFRTYVIRHPKNSCYVFLKKIFKVNTATDIDICFIVSWDLLAAYCHFIFQFVKNDVLITGPLGLLLQPKSPIGNQMQELMNMVMGGERQVGPVPDLKTPSAPPGAAARALCAFPDVCVTT